jgi:hypothetical protein
LFIYHFVCHVRTDGGVTWGLEDSVVEGAYIMEVAVMNNTLAYAAAVNNGGTCSFLKFQ